MNNNLPTYESDITEEERMGNLQIVYEQLKLIKQQERDKIPLVHSIIRCVCLKKVKWTEAYKCLYCGIWFCKACAEEHFGARIDE